MTELSCMTYKNTKTGTRNIHVLGSYLAMIRKYHKGSALTGQDKLIPHALDAFTADLLIQDLAIARPFAELAASICYPGDLEIAKLYRDHVFVDNGKLFTTKDISAKMGSYTMAVMAHSLGVNAWRHVSIAFKRKICPRLTDLMEEDELDNVGSLQEGHSRATENMIYGLTPDALAGPSEDILPLFLDCSTDWQVEFRIVPGGIMLPYRQAMACHFDKLVKDGSINNIRDPTGKEIQHKKMVEDIVEQLDSKIGAANEEKIVDSIMAKLQPALAALITSALASALSKPFELT